MVTNGLPTRHPSIEILVDNRANKGLIAYPPSLRLLLCSLDIQFRNANGDLTFPALCNGALSGSLQKPLFSRLVRLGKRSPFSRFDFGHKPRLFLVDWTECAFRYHLFCHIGTVIVSISCMHGKGTRFL